jgi:hypothetical protein
MKASDYSAGELMTLLVSEGYEVIARPVDLDLHISVSIRYRGKRVVAVEDHLFTDALRGAVQQMVDRDLLKLY